MPKKKARPPSTENFDFLITIKVLNLLPHLVLP